MEDHEECVHDGDENESTSVPHKSIAQLIFDSLLFRLHDVYVRGFHRCCAIIFNVRNASQEWRSHKHRTNLRALLHWCLVIQINRTRSYYARVRSDHSRNILFILLTLQVVHFIGFLPWEKNRGDNNKEHPEGHLKVYLLPGDCLVIQVFICLVRSNDEAHYGWYSYRHDHAVHRPSQEQIIYLASAHQCDRQCQSEDERSAKDCVHG